MTQPLPPRSALKAAPVAGVPITLADPVEAVDWLLDQIERREGVDVRFMNAYSIVSAYRAPEYLHVVQDSGVSFADGAPVAWALRHISGLSGARRVRGPSFFVAALDRSAGRDVRHFFLGTTDPTLERLVDRVTAAWPAIEVAGTHAPPFGPVDDALIEDAARRIAVSGANCVWIALGTPKQDLLAHRLAERTGVPCIAIGAAFDFTAGTKREAPRWMQQHGVEWLYRLLSEPGRLWRRYLIGNVRFLLLVAKHRHL